MTAMGTLHERFADRASAAPDRIAVVAGERSISYGQLDRRANALAAKLRAAGVGREDLVGLCLGRDIELIVGLLGILKASAAYVPIDPDYPADRTRYLLTDSGASAVVTDAGSAGFIRDALPGMADRTITLEPGDTEELAAFDSPIEVSEEQLAYVIYTSGSTGQPKGVLVEHRNAVALFDQVRELAEPSSEDVWTMFHSASFDFSVWEIWGAVLFGARLVLVSSEQARSPQLLRALLARERVSVLSQTPSVFSQLVAADLASGEPPLHALRLVVFGGERLEVKVLEPWFTRYGDQRPVLLNMYGITETTVHVTHRRITRADADAPGLSPIGAPLPWMSIELLDESGNPVPDGTPGEIWVGGSGVARGYLNRPELTAQRFVSRGSGDQQRRMYRSGDRAVRGPDGDYQYLGRTDDQLKVRGFRIEPGEIEAVLVAAPGVATVVVTAEDFGEGDLRLHAYALPSPDAGIEPARLSASLAELAAAKLPEHMRPSSIRIVDSLPRTPQGKVDRSALREMSPLAEGGTGSDAGVDRDGLSQIQQAVLEVVSDVLRRDQIGLDDDFFDLGATSLALMRIIAQVNLRCETSLVGAELTEATSRCLAECVASTR